MTEALWAGMWASLQQSREQATDVRDTLQSTRSITDRFLDSVSSNSSSSSSQQQTDDDTSAITDGPFQIAWKCHSLLTAPSLVSTTAIGQEFTWRLKLGCLTLLEALCRQFTETKSQSPLFPLLVKDSLACLHACAQHERSSATSAMEQACYLAFVESLLPDMFDPQEQYNQVQEAFDAGNVTPEVETLVQNAVQKWVSTYQDDNYVNPLVWAQRGAEVTSLKALQKDADPQSALGVNDAMRPLHSVDAAFARPMPPPLLPLIGYDEDEVALTDQEKQQVNEYLHTELVWLTPTNLRLMLLPDDEKDDLEATERTREVIQLLKTKAFVKPLAPNEQRQVLQMLNEDDENIMQETDADEDDEDNMAFRMVQESGLNPQNLPRLVEHNPLVAYECLVRILTYSTEDSKNDYLSSLIGMDMSLHTMEVVNRLATHNLGSSSRRPILMPEYLHLFISSCIASCENVQDRHAQNRLVRLVCVFVQSLLRNKIVYVEDIYVEVQAFCVEFSRIREATALFKSLKELS